MATNGQFSWPSVGTFVAAYGQFFMAANNKARGVGNGGIILRPYLCLRVALPDDPN
jgi:hypothetical protein